MRSNMLVSCSQCANFDKTHEFTGSSPDPYTICMPHSVSRLQGFQQNRYFRGRHSGRRNARPYIRPTDSDPISAASRRAVADNASLVSPGHSAAMEAARSACAETWLSVHGTGSSSVRSRSNSQPWPAKNRRKNAAG